MSGEKISFVQGTLGTRSQEKKEKMSVTQQEKGKNKIFGTAFQQKRRKRLLGKKTLRNSEASGKKRGKKAEKLKNKWGLVERKKSPFNTKRKKALSTKKRRSSMFGGWGGRLLRGERKRSSRKV